MVYRFCYCQTIKHKVMIKLYLDVFSLAITVNNVTIKNCKSMAIQKKFYILAGNILVTFSLCVMILVVKKSEMKPAQ